MCELASLGAPGGAGGVDEGGGIGRLDGGQPALEFGGVHPGSGLGELVEGRGRARAGDVEHRAQVGQFRCEFFGDLGVGIGFHEQRHRRRVLQHPPDLIGRGRLVDRHGDGADRQHRVVDDRPFVPCRRYQGHAIAGGHALGDKTVGHRADLCRRLRVGDGRPGVVDKPGECRLVGVFALVVVDGTNNRCVVLDGERGRNAELSHPPRLVGASRSSKTLPHFL